LKIFSVLSLREGLNYMKQKNSLDNRISVNW
jgi:hypothetical protein